MNGNNGSKQLYRKREGRIVAGVCTGLADYLGIDTTLIRLGFAVLTIFGFSGVLLYLIAWVVMPDEGEKASIAENLVKQNRDV